MQRVSVSKVLSSSFIRLSRCDVTQIELQVGDRTFVIPSDGVFSNVYLSWAVADSLGVPRSAVKWPRLTGYEEGALGRALGMGDDLRADLAALQYIEQAESEVTTRVWGGIYAAENPAAIFGSCGDIRVLKGTVHYVNVAANENTYNEIREKNPHLAYIGGRVVGGEYPCATKLAPPIHLTGIFRGVDLKLTPVHQKRQRPLYSSRTRALWNEGLRGEQLRNKFKGSSLRELASRARDERGVTQNYIDRMNAQPSPLALEVALDMAVETAGGNENLFARLVTVLPVIFVFDYEGRMLMRREARGE